MSHFCVTAPVDAARRALAKRGTLALSDRDRQAFFNALITPPEPSQRLQRAMAEYKRRMAS